MVEQLAFAHKQVKFVKWHAQEWEKCYEMSMVDYKKLEKKLNNSICCFNNGRSHL
jgi:hypothetical protein